MNQMDSIESMLFGLKEVVKDSDHIDIKKEIDIRIKSINEGVSIDEQTEMAFIKETASAVSTSFQKRQKQLMTDSQIVQKINNKIDDFRLEHQQKVQGLISSLMKDIDDAVDEYSKEIIKRLNPKTIKERFKEKSDFQIWLNTINDSYKEKMEKTVDRKTQNAIRMYMIDVEDVFLTASRYLSERETFIELEDKFYGSLALTKNVVTRDIKNNITSIIGYNKTLYESSVELFNDIWHARQKYETKKSITTVAATTATSLGTYAAVTGMAGASTAMLPIIAGVAACVITGIAIFEMAGKLSDALYSNKLEKDVEACISYFTEEINKSKILMQTRATEAITLVFNNELKSLDTTFLEFRKITYLDEDKLPKIAEQLDQLC